MTLIRYALAVLTAVLTALGTLFVTLFVVYFQRVVGLAQKVLVWAWNRVTVEQAVEARYRKSLARDLLTVQILQMSEPKDLQTFYIPLKLVNFVNWDSPELKETDGLGEKKR